MTPQLRRIITREVKRYNAGRTDWLAYKAALKANIAAHSENGQICVCRAGRDCDGTRYEHRYHVAVPTLTAWLHGEAEHERWLDGPEATWFARPSDEPEGSYSDMGGWED